MQPREPLAKRAEGRWKSILPALGVLSAKALSGKHGPCPMCGGKDRFRFDDKAGRGTWFCSKCGAGDGVKLVMEARGVEFREAAKLVENVVGSARVIQPREERDDADKRRAAAALWDSGQRVTPDSIAGRYLAARCGLSAFPGCLRAVDELRYAGEPVRYLPALLARLDGPDGRPATVHRTYLSFSGGKADVPDPRRLMPGEVPKGSAVRLAPAGQVLGIAEGIETALSAAALFQMPVWAAVNATLMAQWSPPEGVERVVVFADNDASYAGQSAAYGLAARLSAQGFRVDVEVPPGIGQDWNDVHRAKLQEPA